MHKFMIITLSLVSLSQVGLAASSDVRAQQEASFTYGQSSIINLSASGIQGAAAYALKEYYPNAVARVVSELPASGAVLTAEQIADMVETVRRSPLSTFGIGKLGGARLDIVLDINQQGNAIAMRNIGQLQRIAGEVGADMKLEPIGGNQVHLTLGDNGADSAGARAMAAQKAPPQFEPHEINIRTVGGKGGAEGLEQFLTRLQADGVPVRSMAFRSFLAMAGQRVAGTLVILLGGSAAVSGISGIISGVLATTDHNSTWVESNCGYDRDCSEEVGLSDVALNPARQYYYLFVQD